MLSISQRGQDLPASPIRKLVPFAEAAKKRGTKVYHLNIGQPDIETPPAIIDAVKATDIRVLEYSHSAGNESYRRKLVQYYKGVGINVSHDQIMVTTGGSEAILFAFFVCLNPGDEVIIPEPFYANYNSFAVAAGVKVVPVTANIETGFALPPIEQFEPLVTPRTRAIMVCSPNNPTGYLYSREEMEALKTLCLKYNLYLFSDEAYREFCYDGAYVSAMHLTGMDEQVVLIDTISKRYSACGARIGALVTKNKGIYDAAMKFAQARLSPPGLAQIMGEAAVDLPHSYFDGTRAEYQARRDLLVQRLNAIPGVYCPQPGGAFYAIARLPIDDADLFCQWLLESFAHNGQTVMLAPATGFYSTPGLGKQEVRLAYVLNLQDIGAAMDCLEAALAQYPGRIELTSTASELTIDLKNHAGGL
ncbi:pyridoxal phosphate-dependent aminotransferase [Paracnuella aquatica]|uniref:pyridoxal phosphate-dependent aminotransferase n=1 Tax=Paracnuella aquatica TaxID=2268757 RepID=UPI000DEEEFF8|nr:pyridoxal phosphate-dependent aminotransferase [Paracnuella aquatica]RPD43643.1 pyridoxal phosphate-dependent aminotransferase [Paracnuella aquatica]